MDQVAEVLPIAVGVALADEDRQVGPAPGVCRVHAHRPWPQRPAYTVQSQRGSPLHRAACLHDFALMRQPGLSIDQRGQLAQQ